VFKNHLFRSSLGGQTLVRMWTLARHGERENKAHDESHDGQAWSELKTTLSAVWEASLDGWCARSGRFALAQRMQFSRLSTFLHKQFKIYGVFDARLCRWKGLTAGGLSNELVLNANSSAEHAGPLQPPWRGAHPSGRKVARSGA